MSGADLIALLPFIVTAVAAVAALLMAAFRPNHRTIAALTIAGLAAALATLPAVLSVAPREVRPLLVLDHYSVFYLGLLLAGAMVVAALSYGYWREWPGNLGEFYVLLLTATLGSITLAASSHFVSLFLGLEILSVSLYGMAAYSRDRQRSLEAGIKYLILAGASAAFLLFGMAMIYAEVGSMEFARIGAALNSRVDIRGPWLLIGTAMTLVGVGFKLAVAPFHMWTPDVYEGAPAPSTAYVASVSKAAMVGVFLRFAVQTGALDFGAVAMAVGAIAAVSMFVGNLLALMQENVKRILACSSIAHMGYLLVALVAGGGTAAATFYITAYLVTILGAFGVVAATSGPKRDSDSLDDCRGLFWRQPWLAGVLVAALFSLAGIPLTAGFVGKFYVVATGVRSALWALVIILAINSAIGLFYYLRIVVAIYAEPPEGRAGAGAAGALSLAGSVALGAVTILLVWFGVYPAPLLRVIQATVASLM